MNLSDVQSPGANYEPKTSWIGVGKALATVAVVTLASIASCKYLQTIPPTQIYEATVQPGQTLMDYFNAEHPEGGSAADLRQFTQTMWELNGGNDLRGERTAVYRDGNDLKLVAGATLRGYDMNNSHSLGPITATSNTQSIEDTLR